MKRWLPLLAGLSLVSVCWGSNLLWPHTPRWYWNVSPSMPYGLYRLVEVQRYQRGMLILFAPVPAVQHALVHLGIVPGDIPLLKPLAALAGDLVCVTDGQVVINGVPIAPVLTTDQAGRLLPHWQGCSVLAEDDLFPLSTHHPGSMDGRYFGPVTKAQVLGEAKAVWIW